MPEKNDQKIIILIENRVSDNKLILHGIKLATTFKKELCFLLTTSNKEESKDHSNSEILNGYINIVKKEIPSFRVSSLIKYGKLENLIEELTNDYEAIMIISRITLYKDLSKTIKFSQIPFLLVNEKVNIIPNYKKIILPVDFRRETKDAALWASYFARFNNSKVSVYAANDIFKETKLKVTKNIVSIKKLFSKLKIAINIFRGEKSSLRIHFETLTIAKSLKADLIIILGSSNISIFDLLIGLNEKKIIKNAGKLPVMIINPRMDMYILCD